MKIKLNWLWCLLLVLALMAVSCAPAPEVAPPAPEEAPPVELSEYILPVSRDFTGPYADVNKEWVIGDSAVISWWNENRGKEIGVKLRLKDYDFRYDPAIISSMWPGILAELHPIAHFGIGGSDVAALLERLADDKVPMFNPGACYGFLWARGLNWMPHFRSLYQHEAFSFVDHLLRQWPEEDLPLKWATVTTDVYPAYVDMDRYYKSWAAEDKYKGRMEYLGAAWVPPVPVDITDSIRPFIKKDVDWFIIQTNVPHVVATARACEALGKHVPIAMAPHISPRVVADILTLEKMEGFCWFMGSATELNYDTAGYKEIWCKYHPADVTDVKAGYVPNVLIVIARGAVFGKVVEKAVADVGAANLTGEAIYNAVLEVDLNEDDCAGLVKGVKWTTESPFPPVEKLGVQYNEVKDGKCVLVPGWLPIPDLPMLP